MFFSCALRENGIFCVESDGDQIFLCLNVRSRSILKTDLFCLAKKIFSLQT